MTIRRRFYSLITTVLLLSGVVGCTEELNQSPPAPAPVEVATIDFPKSADIQMERYSGTVRAHRQVDLAFRLSGYVTTLLIERDLSGGVRAVQEGDYVPDGAVLARIDSSDYQAGESAAAAQTGSALATIDQARSRFAQATSARQQAVDGVGEAAAALQAAVAQRGEAAAAEGEAAAAESNAQSDVTLAQSNFQTTDSLYQSGSATKPQDDGAKSALDSATSKLAGARQAFDGARSRVDESVAGIRTSRERILQAQSGVHSADAAIRDAGAAVVVAEGQADQARASQSAEEIQVGHTALCAPFSGVILSRRTEVGALAAPGIPVFTLADTSCYNIDFGLPETKAGLLRIGQRVTLTAGLQDAIVLAGTVSAIAPAADGRTGVFDVQVTVPSTDSDLRIGMAATLELTGGAAGESGLVAPVSAVVSSPAQSDRFAVVVVDTADGLSTAHYRDVQVGAATGDSIVVRGLARGTLVVTSGPAMLSDGEAVKIVAQTSEADYGTR